MKVFTDTRVPIKAWVDGVSIEPEAIQQLKNAANMPFLFKHLAVMPDVHAGIGATVGSVISTKGAIIPAAVGVDIGCGMLAVQTSLTASDLPDNLHQIRCDIEKAVPHGRTTTTNGGYNPHNDRGLWSEAPHINCDAMVSLQKGLDAVLELEQNNLLNRAAKGAVNQLGTLGTGNHFIEICLDEHQNVWVMLHTGSRGVGNRIGTHFIEKAKEECSRWFINLPDQDLAYFPEGNPYFEKYMKAVHWAQEFAKTNREIMLQAVQNVLKKHFPEVTYSNAAINCHHNYVSRENHFGSNIWVTRKGAVRAREGELGIIPASMGAKSYIVRGKGNPESFCSCSHGAGRTMSRTKARASITLQDHIKATEGVECRKDEDVLDESPAAYKDIDAVMEAQKDLVEVVRTLKQIICVKG